MDEGPNSPPACPVHPGAVVAGTCGRCGRFCCDECFTAQGLCVACQVTEERAAVEGRIVTQLRGLALGEGVRVLLIGGLTFAARGSLPIDERHWVYLGAAVTALPFLALAVALWMSGKVWLVWPALALDLIVFGGMALRVHEQPALAAALLALPAASILRMVRVWKLARRAKDFPFVS